MYAATLGDTILADVALTGAVWFLIVSVSITFLILFFGEIIPKVFATKYALKFALMVTPVIQFVIYLLYPFVYILEIVIKWFHKILWTDEDKVTRDDIEIFVEEGKKQWLFSASEALIVHNFLEFRQRFVESIFQHRTNVFAVSEELTLAEAVVQMHANSHSRVPIFRWDKDQIVGLISLRAAFRLYTNTDNHNKKLKEFGLNTINKVPVTASIFDVFMDMKKHGWHFAVVIDEYGGTAWIVTFEDILEDLVWAIRDETDTLEVWDIIKENDTSLRVKWEVPLRDVIDALHLKGWKFSEEKAEYLSEEETVSYIIIHCLKDFAKQWDVVRLWKLWLEVIKVNKHWDKIVSVRALYDEERKIEE